MVDWRAESDDPNELTASLSETFFERLHVFAARRLRDIDAAEEVAQEALRRALEALRSGRVANRNALPAFLFETARNICLQRHRSAGREARALERLGGAETHGASAPHALDSLIAAEDIQQVRQALNRLDPQERDVLLWSYRDGLDAAEIGERLGITPGAVRVRRHRALSRLAGQLGVTLPPKREHM
jgi:RNA polymerase sigma factor (sigma-70 family)